MTRLDQKYDVVAAARGLGLRGNLLRGLRSQAQTQRAGNMIFHGTANHDRNREPLLIQEHHAQTDKQDRQ
jgi:hypothetical protein